MDALHITMWVVGIVWGGSLVVMVALTFRAPKRPADASTLDRHDGVGIDDN